MSASKLLSVAVGVDAVGQLEHGFGVTCSQLLGDLCASLAATAGPTGQSICFLDAMARILGLFAFKRFFQGPYFSFVDNTAAQFALGNSHSTDNIRPSRQQLRHGLNVSRPMPTSLMHSVVVTLARCSQWVQSRLFSLFSAF